MPDNNTNPGMGISPLGTAAIGAGSGIVSNIMDIAFGKMRQRQALEGQKKSQEIATAAQLDIWNKTNFEAQKEHIKNAGLSTGLMYGMGGAGGATTGSTAGTVPGGQGGGGMDIAGAAQLQLITAQAENIKAQTEKIRQDTRTGATQEQLNLLEGVIKKYAGKEAGAQFNINDELRTLEFGMKADEYEARQSQASNLVRMYQDGTLQKMSDAELENRLLEIGVKKGTIRKLELENALTEMEKNLQEKFGMGRDSKSWIDMGIKLIMLLMGRK